MIPTFTAHFQKFLFLAVVLFVPILVLGQNSTERSTETNASSEARGEVEVRSTSDDNSRSDRSTVTTSEDVNVCDGVTCADGSCAATSGECGPVDVVTPIADSVCNGFVCDSGECVSDELWCGVDFDFLVDTQATAVDSVCNGYLCDDGTCVSGAQWCEMNLGDLPASVNKCPAGSPIRCGDGSCSSDVNRCLAIESRMTTEGAVRTDVDGDGVPDSRDLDSDDDSIPDRAQNHNSSRSNRSGGIVSESRDLDSDGDGIGDSVEPAQDYNSTRSNRRKNVFDGGGNGGDGWPQVTLRAGAFIRLGSIEGEAITRDNIDSTVVCWGRAEDVEGRVYAWGSGLCVALDNAEERSATGTARLAAVQVRGDEVRSWGEDERAAWREYVESQATTSPEEHLAAQMVERTQADERIKEMRADYGGVEVRYEAQMRLFGFIPLNREVDARADTEGNLMIDYPWYRFLSATPDREQIRSLLLDTMDIVVLVPGRAG